MATTSRARARSRKHLDISNGASVHDIADVCRTAVLEFLAGAASGWRRVDLDLWLAAPYLGATSAFRRGKGRGRTVCTTARVRASSAVLEAALMEAGESLREMIVSCAAGGQPMFVVDALDLGFVAGARDENGVIGYAPVDVGEMHLLDRVASLLAADFLTRPRDYEAVSICEDCGAVSFAWTTCDGGTCEAQRVSGVIRHEATPPPSYPSILPPRGC